MLDKQLFDAFCKDAGIEMKTLFVPFSMSRNSKEERKTLNFKVVLKNIKHSFDIDYSKGVGYIKFKHVGDHNSNMSTNAKNRLINKIVESGKTEKTLINEYTCTASFENPAIDEILYSLQCDALLSDCSSFDAFCWELGYDNDSRSAYKIYEACQGIKRDLDKLLTRDQQDTLQELLQDY